MIHELKCWPEFFIKVYRGDKKFEIRKNDRDYQIGDRLLLKEWEPFDIDGNGHYTGDELLVKVTYILKDYVGLKEGYIVMGIK